MNTSTSTYTQKKIMSTKLLNYYEAIEKASADMLSAARSGNWDEVVKLEGACAVLIAQLKNAAQNSQLMQNEAKEKSRIMQRILLNDAEIRHLAEPWARGPRSHDGRQARDASLSPHAPAESGSIRLAGPNTLQAGICDANPLPPEVPEGELGSARGAALASRELELTSRCAN